MDFLPLGERQVATARLLCDVSRNHAASLTEPLLAGLLVIAGTLRRFISEKALTNQQPELAEVSPSRMLGHRTTPLLQRCCDDSLNRRTRDSRSAAHSMKKVERETGFEPATSTLARSRSTK